MRAAAAAAGARAACTHRLHRVRAGERGYMAAYVRWGRTLGGSGDVFGCNLEMLLASSGERARMLLNIITCIGDSFTIKTYSLQMLLTLKLRTMA